MRICEALSLPRGITAVVGGGGKTSLLDRLSGELRSEARVLRMTTTHMFPPDCEICEPEPDVIRRGFQKTNLLAIGTKLIDGRLGGVLIPEAALLTLADYILVEADGSRGFSVKAPAAHEPVLPQNAALVVAVAGMSALGRPIKEAAHRPEIFADLVGKKPEDRIEPEDIARVLYDLCGARKNVRCDFAVFLNQADDPARKDGARRIARQIPCRTVIAALRGDPDYYEQWRDGKCLS